MGFYIGESGYYSGDRKGFDVEVTERPSQLYDLVDGEWVFDIARSINEKIEKLQAAYDADLDKLNKALLSALIADGIGEATRQSIIKSQMIDLEAQLEADILNVFMEQ